VAPTSCRDIQISAAMYASITNWSAVTPASPVCTASMSEIDIPLRTYLQYVSFCCGGGATRCSTPSTGSGSNLCAQTAAFTPAALAGSSTDGDNEAQTCQQANDGIMLMMSMSGAASWDQLADGSSQCTASLLGGGGGAGTEGGNGGTAFSESFDVNIPQNDTETMPASWMQGLSVLFSIKAVLSQFSVPCCGGGATRCSASSSESNMCAVSGNFNASYVPSVLEVGSDGSPQSCTIVQSVVLPMYSGVTNWSTVTPSAAVCSETMGILPITLGSFLWLNAGCCGGEMHTRCYDPDSQPSSDDGPSSVSGSFG
jgi:hypothetical protein